MPNSSFVNNWENVVNKDEQLKALYQQRKEQVKAPHSTRQLLLTKARAEQIKPGYNLWNWMLGISLCAALLVLFQFVGITHQQLRPEYEVIQVHRLNEEKQPGELAALVAEQTRVEHADNYARYIQGQQILTAHHKRLARLLNTEDGWGLQTCDKELVLLTAQLVEQMHNSQQLPAQLSQGDTVEIAFDADGRIVSIKAAPGLHC